MEQYIYISCFNFDLTDYVLYASKEKLIIYSTEILNEMQVIRNFNSDIKSLCTSKKNGLVGIICETEFLIYSPLYSEDITLKWELVYRENIESNFKYAIFTNDDEYLFSFGSDMLILWKLKFKLENDKNVIESINELYKLEINDKIEKLNFSPDGKFFSTLGELQKIVFIWDFTSLLSKSFDQYKETNLSSLTNFALSHKVKVIDFFFRETIADSLSKDVPNSLITIDSDNILRIWQESILKDKIFFFHSNTLILSKTDIPKIPSIKWIMMSKKRKTKNTEIITYEKTHYSNLNFGTYDVDSCSVDWLGVFSGKMFKIYQITGLRNQGNNSNFVAFKEFLNPDIFKNIKDIIFLEMKAKKNILFLEIIGKDFKNCILKIILNVNNPSNYTVINSAKYRYGNIILTSFNKENNSFMILNHAHELIYVKPISLFSFPDDYSRLGFYQRKITQLATHILDSSQYIFHSKDLAIFIDKSFKEIYVVSITNLGILPFNYSKEINSDISVLEELFNNEIEPIVKVINVVENDNININEFTFICGIKEKIICFKMIFLLNKIKEMISFYKATQKQPNEIYNPNSTFKTEYFLLIEDVSVFNFDGVEFSDFKIFGYNDITNNFEVGLQQKNKMNYYKVENGKPEKLKEFIFKTTYKEFNKTESIPSLFYFLTELNDIEFYKESGEFLCHFSLKKLFFNESSFIDIPHLTIGLKHLYDVHFLLSIENFFIIFSLIFDKQYQTYVLNFLTKNEESNEIYFKRVSKRSNPKSYQLFVGRNRDIFLKTFDSIKAFHGNFEKLVADPKTEYFDPSNIHARLLKTKNNIPFHHPEFIYELLNIGKCNLVNFIFHEMMMSIAKKGYISSKFFLSLEEMDKKSQKPEEDITYDDILEEMKRPSNNIKEGGSSPSRSSILRMKMNNEFQMMTLEIEGQNPLLALKNSIQNNRKNISLKGPESIMLISLIDFYLEYLENKRGLDDYATIFLFFVKVFKMTQKHIGNVSKQKSMLTKEIVWAMHSLQKETLLYECIDKEYLQQNESEENILQWNDLKKYGVVIWCNTIEKLKDYIEIIAKNEYKAKKEAHTVALWYILLNKKNILANLFKQDKAEKKTYEFLTKNFLEPRWKSAANKNAYALLAKKRFEESAAFFLLGGFFEEAINIVINNIQDIQLALLFCRLLETNPEKPIFKKIIKEHFIESGKLTNDLWLVHIGYVLLNQYINSLNCLYEFNTLNEIEYDESGKKTCPSWPATFQPHLSSFHPSAMVLAAKLKDNINLKRELQNENQSKVKEVDIFDSFWGDDDKKEEIKEEVKDKIILKEDFVLHITLSLEYYLSVNNPMTGLLYYLNHRNDIISNIKIKDTLKKLVTKHLEFIIEESVIENDWENYFKGLFEKIKNLALFFDINEIILNKHCFRKIHLLRSLKYTSAFLLGQNDLVITFEKIDEFAIEVQKLYYYSLYSNPFAYNPKYFWLDLIYSCQELSFSYILLINSQVYNDFNDKEFYDKKIILIEFFIFFSLFYIVINLQEYNYLDNLIEEYNLFIENSGDRAKFCLPNEKFNYLNLFSYLRMKTDKFSNMKQKDLKIKNDDILSNIFKNTNDIKKEKSEKEIDNKIFLVELIIKYLCATYYLKISQKYIENVFQVESDLSVYDQNLFNINNIFIFLKQNEFMNYQAIKSISNKINPIIRVKLINELKLIFTNFSNIEKVNYYKDLGNYVNLENLQIICKKMNFEENINDLVFKFEKKLSKLKDYPKTDNFLLERQKLFINGIELINYKEQIKSICFNKFNNSNDELVVITSKHIKKVSIKNQLLRKKRTADGSMLSEEESISPVIGISPLVKLSHIDILNKPINIRIAHCLLFQKGLNEESPSLMKNHYNRENFSEIKEENEKENNFFNYVDVGESQILCSHPKLPMFFCGNRGSITIMSFNTLDKLGNLESNFKDSLINVVKISHLGDKIGGVDTSGRLFLWKFNRFNQFEAEPFFTIQKRNIVDFCFMNEGSVFCTVSQGQKPCFSLWDTLLPLSKVCFATESFNCTNVNYCSQKKMLIFSNFKKNNICFFDLKKNMIVKNLDFIGNEIRYISINNAENCIFIGTQEGIIKSYELDNFEPVQEFKPFRNEIYQKKKNIAITNIFEINNCLLASNGEGQINIVGPTLY